MTEFSASCDIRGYENDKDLEQTDKHNNRKFSEKSKTTSYINRAYTVHNIRLVGTDNISNDLKKLYEDEFGEAINEYNLNQKRKDRRIYNYFEKISEDKKTNLYTSVILQFNDFEYWKDKTLDEKKQAKEVLVKQFEYFKEQFPEFAVANATIHLDESSPHLHIVGVAVQEDIKAKLTKKASQNKCFTRERLLKFHENFQNHSMEFFKDIYKTNDVQLKPKGKKRKRLNDKEYKEMKDNSRAITDTLDNAKKLMGKVILDKEQAKAIKDRITENSHLLLEMKEIDELKKSNSEKKLLLEQEQEQLNRRERQLATERQQLEQVRENLYNAQEQFRVVEEKKKKQERLLEQQQSELERIKQTVEEQAELRAANEKAIKQQNAAIIEQQKQFENQAKINNENSIKIKEQEQLKAANAAAIDKQKLLISSNIHTVDLIKNAESIIAKQDKQQQENSRKLDKQEQQKAANATAIEQQEMLQKAYKSDIEQQQKQLKSINSNINTNLEILQEQQESIKKNSEKLEELSTIEQSLETVIEKAKEFKSKLTELVKDFTNLDTSKLFTSIKNLANIAGVILEHKDNLEKKNFKIPKKTDPWKRKMEKDRGGMER